MNIFFFLTAIQSSSFELSLVKSIFEQIKTEITSKRVLVYNDDDLYVIHKINLSESFIEVTSEDLQKNKIPAKRKIIYPNNSFLFIDKINSVISKFIAEFGVQRQHEIFIKNSDLCRIFLECNLDGNVGKKVYIDNLLGNLSKLGVKHVRIHDKNTSLHFNHYKSGVIYNEFFNECWSVVYKFRDGSKQCILNFTILEKDVNDLIKIYYDSINNYHTLGDEETVNFLQEHCLNVGLFSYNFNHSSFVKNFYIADKIKSCKEYNLRNNKTKEKNTLLKEDISYKDHKNLFDSLKTIREVYAIFSLVKRSDYFKNIIYRSLINSHLERFYLFLEILYRSRILTKESYKLLLLISRLFDYPVMKIIFQYLLEDIVTRIRNIDADKDYGNFKNLLVYFYLFLKKEKNVNFQHLNNITDQLFLVNAIKERNSHLIKKVNEILFFILHPRLDKMIILANDFFKIISIPKKDFQVEIESFKDLIKKNY